MRRGNVREWEWEWCKWEWLRVFVLILLNPVLLLNAVPQLVPQQARLTDRTPCFLILHSSCYSYIHSVKPHRLHLCPHFTIFVLVVVSVLMLLCVLTLLIPQASRSHFLVHRRARRMPNLYMI